MVLIIFAVLAVTGQILNVLFCLALDKIVSPVVGGLTFVPLYMLVFVGAWYLSVWIVERWQPAEPTGKTSRTVPRGSRPILKTSTR